jgi:hypothetical protein
MHCTTPKSNVQTTRTLATQNHCTRLRSSNHHCFMVLGTESSKYCFNMTNLSCQNLKWSIWRCSSFSCPQEMALGSRLCLRECNQNHLRVDESCVGRRRQSVRIVSSIRPGEKKLLERIKLFAVRRRSKKTIPSLCSSKNQA